MGWTGHVARMGEVHIRLWYGIVRERDHLEVPDIDRRIILKLIKK